MLQRICWVAVLVVFGCAESAPPKSPEASEAPPATADESAPAKTAEREGEPVVASASSESGAAHGGAVSKEDAEAVLQLVIDDEALGPYLHLERPDRFPLRIGGSALPPGIELTKATKPVIIVADVDAEKKPVIVFTEINITGDEASVRYRHDVEKLRGSSTLKRRDKQWVLVRSRVTEH